MRCTFIQVVLDARSTHVRGGTAAMATPLQQLCAIGQSPCYDSIQRSLITSGGLQALIDRGIRGVTVNPAIFEKAILGSTDYDAAIQDLLTKGGSPPDSYERL